MGLGWLFFHQQAQNQSVRAELDGYPTGREKIASTCMLKKLATQSVFMIHQYHLEIVGNAVRSCWGSSETFLNQSWLTGTVSECRSLPGDHGDIKKVSIAEIPSH